MKLVNLSRVQKTRSPVGSICSGKKWRVKISLITHPSLVASFSK
jgi:hypothetical protein